MDFKNKKILITGSKGFLGSYLLENLIEKRKFNRKNIFITDSKKVDLRKKEDCQKVVKGMDIVFHLAAHLGGVDYQRREPARIFYDNVLMFLQLIEAAYQAGVQKFITIGSITAYPEKIKPPFAEKDLWNGFPEEMNYAYALAKRLIAAQCKAYQQQYKFKALHLILPNLYGPLISISSSYNYHAIPIFIDKLIKVKKEGLSEIQFRGTGKAIREFFYVEDAAEAIIQAAEKYDDEDPLNLGSGEIIHINQLVQFLSQLIDFKGKIKFDKSGKLSNSKRFLNSSRFQKLTGFKPKTNFETGLKETIKKYVP